MTQAKVGYAAMLEQFAPQEVVGYSARAEAAGFDGVMAADHFQPWVPQQGQAAFVWNVLTAIGERTKGDLGPGVTCPSFRMHPAIVAQASATLAAMYPGRHWLGLGSGEALNEHIVGGYWPETPERIARMFEAIEIIRKLFDNPARTSSTTASSSRWSRRGCGRCPAEPPPIYIATAGPVTAKKTGHVRQRPDHGRRARREARDDLREVPRGLPRGRQRPEQVPVHRAAPPVVGADRGGGPPERHGRVAQRRHEVPQAGHQVAARPGGDGQAGPAGGLQGPDADQRRSRGAPAPTSRSSSTWASTRSISTTSGATRRPGSTCSPARSCPSWSPDTRGPRRARGAAGAMEIG